MKKSLSFIAMFVLANFVNAQIKTWDFNNSTEWPTTTVIDYNKDYNGLKFVAGSSSLSGIVVTSSDFLNGYAPTQALKFGGNSYSSSTNPAVGSNTLPTRRYIEINVTENSEIKIWGKGGGATRSIVITDKATSTVINNTSFTNQNEAKLIVANYTGSNNTLIISTGGGDNWIHKIELTPSSSLSTSNLKKINTTIFTTGKNIIIKDLKSKNTEIKVYNMNGTLVKSLKTSTDIQFELNNGLYIIHTKSELGEKSVKVSIK